MASTFKNIDDRRKTIVLLPAEQVLREFLLEAAQEFPGLEIWITGGWVRDRLLDITSSDIDLALNNLTGRQFGKFLEIFSARPEIKSKYDQKAADLGISHSSSTKFTIIERNAEMAKQLETAHGKLFGLDIDLVNLRKEVYNGQSRTPEMEFGTAEEDAFRRDATVNAIFFHLENQEVVDLTGKGLEDLEARIMRTPLDPRQTFMDDPLRVLRLIRIGSKLGFSLDSEARSCMRDNEIQVALDTIITRDRINMEFFKMTRDRLPEVALQQIFECNLFTPIFLRLNSPLLESLKTIFSIQDQLPWPATWPRAYNILANLLHSNSKLGMLIQSEENVDHLWAMAAYTPIAGLRHDRLQEAVQDATNALRLPAKITKLLESALANFDSIQNLIDEITSQSEEHLSRSQVGMAIRSFGSTWRTQVTYVLLAQAVHVSQTGIQSGPIDLKSASEELLIEPLLEQFSIFANFIWDQDLQDAHLMRPLLDGNQIQSLFGLQKGGKYLKVSLKALVAWQFDHKNESVEEAKMWLLEQRDALEVPPL